MQGLSIVVITLNEERNIDRCLGSVRWANEIVVVDSFSSDKTVERARAYTDRVYQHEYPGSSRQVERGVTYATGPWILILDADEEVTPALAKEMQEALTDPGDAAAFEILRRPMAFGHWIEHGGWFPDYQERLFRKDRYRVDHAEVHGGFAGAGPRRRLEGMVHHYTYEHVFDYVSRMNEYTSLEVTSKLARKPDLVVRKRDLILHPLAHFLRRYVVLKGYRDGFHGFVLALLDATYNMMLYTKLWEYRMRRNETPDLLPPITNAALNWRKRAR